MAKRVESKEKIMEILTKYMERENLHDFKTYAVNQGIYGMHKMEKWVEFAKENLSKEEFARFYSRIHPLEPSLIKDDTKAKEELKKRVVTLANDIPGGIVTIFDVFDRITPSLFEYMTMLRECTYKYKILSQSVYKAASQWFEERTSYCKPLKLGSKFINLTDEEEKGLHEFIEEYGLPVNDITYRDAYYYHKYRGLIKSNSR